MRASKNTKSIYLGIALMVASLSGYAQYQPLVAQYYQNRYIANPAFAGIEGGKVINLAYRGRLSNVDGSPQNQLITGSFRVNEKVGLGFQLSNATAGLLGTLGAKASYAYHLPLGGNNQNLHMGLSAGFQKDRIDQSSVIQSGGAAADPMVAQFNDRELVFQGDVGFGYNYNEFSAQFSLSNLGRLLSTQAKQAGYPTFYGTLGYKFGKESDITVQPMLSVMGVQSGNTLLGAGARAGVLDDKLQLTVYYHTNSTVTAAMGYAINDRIKFLGGYNVSGQQVQGYTNGSFELGLSVDLKKKTQD